jgi:hypothetical protein
MTRLALLALCCASLAACKKEAPPTTPGNTGGDDQEPIDVYACVADDECVAVELQCCDACNGGEIIGVNRGYVDLVLADTPRGRGECEGTACTKMACPPPVPACEAGKCVLRPGSFE